MEKMCWRCGKRPAIKTEKYCVFCRKDVLQEMKDSGYFTEVPPRTKPRPADQCEDVMETRYGPKYMF